MCHYWLLKTGVRSTDAQTENNLVSTVQQFQHCRYIASWKMNSVTQMLGGVGVTVHVDETVLIKKKYNGGHPRANNVWVLGIYDTTLKKGMMVIPNRSAQTLLPVIQRLVLLTIAYHSWVIFMNE